MTVVIGHSAPATSTGGFSFGSALGAPAAPAAATSTTTALALGGGLFAQKPAGGFSFNTPASSNVFFFKQILTNYFAF